MNSSDTSEASEMTERLWFTADHHFGHANSIRFCGRPFATVGEMNEALIANWNRVVGPTGTVYHLGDLFLLPSGEAKKIRTRLNGNIYLIRGNHDRTAESLKGALAWIKDYYELRVADPEAPSGRQHIVLCHYAFRIWNRSHHGAWHLYGHSHGTLPETPGQLAFDVDVGVDYHGFTPLGYHQVKQAMRERSSVARGAHCAEDQNLC
jgi:calcineurin-like phosphoesterase family protein